VSWYDYTGTILSTDTPGWETPTTGGQQYEYVIDAPANTVTARVRLLIDDNTTATETIFVSYMQVFRLVGSIDVASNIESDTYNGTGAPGSGTTGWKIWRDSGSAEFNDVYVRGLLTAGNVKAGLNVSGANDGLYVDTHNYWLDEDGTSDTLFKVGDVTDYILVDTGAAATIKMSNVQVEGLLELKTSGIFRSNTAYPYVEMSQTLGAYVAIKESATSYTRFEHTSGMSIWDHSLGGSITIDDDGTIDVSATAGIELRPGTSDDKVQIFGDATGANVGNLVFKANATYTTDVAIERYANDLRLYYGSSEKFRFDMDDGNLYLGQNLIFDDFGDSYLNMVATQVSVILNGTEYLRVNSNGIAVGGDLRLGIGSNDYINHDDANSYTNFVHDGSWRARIQSANNQDSNPTIAFTGNMGSTTGTAVVITSHTGRYELHAQSSGEQFKKDIAVLDIEALAPKVDELMPKKFRYKGKGPHGEKRQPELYGLVAQDVAKAIPQAAVYDVSSGEKEVTDFQDRAVIATLVAAVQNLRRRITALESAQ
jgi:hypothetical protein